MYQLLNLPIRLSLENPVHYVASALEPMLHLKILAEIILGHYCDIPFLTSHIINEQVKKHCNSEMVIRLMNSTFQDVATSHSCNCNRKNCSLPSIAVNDKPS